MNSLFLFWKYIIQKGLYEVYTQRSGETLPPVLPPCWGKTSARALGSHSGSLREGPCRIFGSSYEQKGCTWNDWVACLAYGNLGNPLPWRKRRGGKWRSCGKETLPRKKLRQFETYLQILWHSSRHGADEDTASLQVQGSFSSLLDPFWSLSDVSFLFSL